MNITELSTRKLRVMRRQYEKRVERFNELPELCINRPLLVKDTKDAQQVVLNELKRRIIEVDITEKLALTIWSEDGEQTELYAEVKWYDGNDEQDYYAGHLELDSIDPPANSVNDTAKSMVGRLVNVYINKVEKS